MTDRWHLADNNNQEFTLAFTIQHRTQKCMSIVYIHIYAIPQESPDVS